MSKKISISDKILVAGAYGMAGSAIYRSLIKNGYGSKNNGGIIFTPRKSELDYTDINEVENWFAKNKPRKDYS